MDLKQHIKGKLLKLEVDHRNTSSYQDMIVQRELNLLREMFL
ncbi:hypothetical protein HanIR_Chr03g0126641 [Helianthus annuus]|nr:hypothetical protein HanIR_Chr03g0126641 [Helianthus annuus]